MNSDVHLPFAWIPYLKRFLILEESGKSYKDTYDQHWGVEFLKRHHPETIYLSYYEIENSLSKNELKED
jgi:hypothetical protein